MSISKNTKILFFIIACVHFFTVLHYSVPSFKDTEGEERLVYVITKTIAFIIIVLMYRFIPYAFMQIKEKNRVFIDCAKYTLFYFLLSASLIFITKPFPLSSFDSYFIISNVEHFGIFWRQNFIPSLMFLVSKSIFPSYYTVSILCCLIYSLIFSYSVINAKKQYGSKHYLVLLFFLMPCILICSLVQYNNVLFTYLLSFLLMFIFFNVKTNCSNVVKASLLGLLSAVVILLRTENIFLLILIPLMIFHLKIFSKKSFIIYLSSLFILFSPMYYIQKVHINYEYVLHNLSFIYDFYKYNNIEVENNDKEALGIVFPAIKTGYNGTLADYFMYNPELKENKNAVNILIKMAVKQAPLLIRRNNQMINKTLNGINFMPLKMSSNRMVYDNHSFSLYPVKSKIISLMAYGTQNFRLNPLYKLFYDLTLSVFLLIIFLLYGIIKRKNFFIYVSLILSLNLISILIFMPFYMFFYLYPLLFIARLSFILLIMPVLPEFKNIKKSLHFDFIN